MERAITVHDRPAARAYPRMAPSPRRGHTPTPCAALAGRVCQGGWVGDGALLRGAVRRPSRPYRRIHGHSAAQAARPGRLPLSDSRSRERGRVDHSMTTRNLGRSGAGPWMHPVKHDDHGQRSPPARTAAAPRVDCPPTPSRTHLVIAPCPNSTEACGTLIIGFHD